MKSNTTILYYNDLAVGGSSDKEYRVQVEKQGAGYVVNFQYGRRGGTLQSGTKTITPVSLPEANIIFDKLYREKTKNGYQPAADQRASGYIARHDPEAMEAAIAAADLTTEFPIEEMDEVGSEEAETYVKSSNYLLQFKADAHHCQIKRTDSGVTGYNKRGTQVALPADLIAEVKRLNMKDFVIVGEIDGSKLVVWEMLRARGVSIAKQAYETRLNELQMLIPVTSKLISVSETFTTTATKQSAIATAFQKREEGVCFKLRSAPYRAGTGSHKKFKFLKTVSCRVTAVGVDGKSNAAVALRDTRGTWSEVAHVSTIGKGPIALGTIVEVVFLYATAGRRLYQPRIKEVRTDVMDYECTFARQLKPEYYKQGVKAA